MKVYILLIAYFINTIIVNGQSDECKIFKSAVENSLFNNTFKICNFDSTIIIYDEIGYLSDCLPMDICNKKITISHDTIFNSIKPGKYNKLITNNLIILFRIEKEKSNTTLMYYRPSTGAVLHLTFKMKKNCIKLIKHVIGDF